MWRTKRAKKEENHRLSFSASFSSAKLKRGSEMSCRLAFFFYFPSSPFSSLDSPRRGHREKKKKSDGKYITKRGKKNRGTIERFEFYGLLRAPRRGLVIKIHPSELQNAL